MSRQMIGVVALAAAIILAILGIAPQARVTTNEASTEVYGIDIFGVTKDPKQVQAKIVPADVQTIPAHWAPLTGDSSN
jgi:hypothetical protein